MSVHKNPIPTLAVDEFQAAAALGVSVHFLRKDRQTHRRIPFFKLGGRCLYSPERIREALLALEAGGPPARTRKQRGAA